MDEIDDVTENIQDEEGEYNYIISIRLTAQEANIVGECSGYVRERISACKLGRTNMEGLTRLTCLLSGSFFNFRIQKYKSGDSKSIESFWKEEFVLQCIRGEWFYLLEAQQKRFMSAMQSHVDGGCKSFQGKNVDELKQCWKSLVTPESERQQWKSLRDAEVARDFVPANTPAPGFVQGDLLSPHDSFTDLLPSTQAGASNLIGVIRLGESIRPPVGAKVNYLTKVVVPKDTQLTPRDTWMIGSKIKAGSSDDAYKRLESLQVGCPFDLEMMYFTTGDEHRAIEEAFKVIFDLQKHHSEVFQLLREQVQMFVNELSSYILTCPPEQVTPIIGKLEPRQDGDVTRFACFQVNNMSTDDRGKRSLKIDQMTDCIENNSIDIAGLLEVGIDWRKYVNKTLADFFPRISNCGSAVSYNTTENTRDGDGCHQPGGTGNLTMEDIDPYVGKVGGDRRGLGRYSCMELGNTIVFSIYAMHYSSSPCYNAVVNQNRRYIKNNNDISETNPRRLLNQDILAHVGELVLAGKQVVIMMDANECIINGELCAALVAEANELGLREIIHTVMTEQTNTHDRGTNAHFGVWVTSALEVTGCALVKVVADHKTPIFDITNSSLGVALSRSDVKPGIMQQAVSDDQRRKLFGRLGPVTMNNFKQFASRYGEKIRTSHLQKWDLTTRSVLVPSNYTPPILCRWNNRTRRLKKGGITEDELYRLLVGISKYGQQTDTSCLWSAIYLDADIGLSLTRRSSDDVRNKTRWYLERIGLLDRYDSIWKEGGNVAELIFQHMGLQYDRLDKSWYLKLSNEFLLGRVRKHNTSDDRLLESNTDTLS